MSQKQLFRGREKYPKLPCKESSFLSITLISMFPTLAVERIIGLPTNAGKICSGKLDPAYPHFTNYKGKIPFMLASGYVIL